MADYIGSLDRLLSSFKNKLGFKNLVPGTKAYQIAESIAYEETKVELRIDDYATKNSLFTSSGRDLDKIGSDIFGIDRLQEVSMDISNSMRILKFYVDLGTFGDINKDSNGMPNSITISKGTSIFGSVDGIDYTFATDREYILGVNESELFVSAIFLNGDITMIPSGTLSNHSHTNYSANASKLLKVTNPSPVSTGRVKESDDNYRYRISNGLRSNNSTTYYGIENAILKIPGVSSVNISNATSGGGTFSVFVQGTTPVTSDDIISKARQVISSMVPPWVSFEVYKPSYVGIECGLDVTVRSISAATAVNIINSVSSMINNFSGGTLYLSSILQQAKYSDGNILNVSFNLLNVYYGVGDYRMSEYKITNANDTLTVYPFEKLIVEPIANAILVEQIIQ